jgi:hypothetical protein
MGVVIGPYSLEGTDAQNAILAPMAQTMADTLEQRVQATHVRVLPRNQMPWAKKPDQQGNGGIRARGFWDAKRYPDDILLADDLFPTPELARKTFAHEGIHQLDAQWMLQSNRKDIKPLFDPDAAGWPSEEFAVYGSAAIFGFRNPPYTTYYNDYILPPTSWPNVKAYALRDDHPVEPPPTIPPDPPTQVIEVPAGTSVVIKAV